MAFKCRHSLLFSYGSGPASTVYVRQALYHSSTPSLSLQLLLCSLPHLFTLCRKGTERKGSVQGRLVGEPVRLLVLIIRAWAAQRKLCR